MNDQQEESLSTSSMSVDPDQEESSSRSSMSMSADEEESSSSLSMSDEESSSSSPPQKGKPKGAKHVKPYEIPYIVNAFAFGG